MMQLPKEFETYTKQLFGEERYSKFIASFEEEQPVSIRLNPSKLNVYDDCNKVAIPWCRNAFWLKERPVFTLDPLLHAGCYYVQEAGSMFLDEVIRQHVGTHATLENALDLCAAPGGKSTLIRAALQPGTMLYCNEPDHRRANILMENMQKQGYHNIIVTNSFAKDYQRSRLLFDLIVTDVPCSGEGMFRKDAGAIAEWSLQNVMKCAQLQRSIIADIWPCLREGGLLVYSTCTFNTHENEENIRWIIQELGAEVLPVDIKPEWNITNSLLHGFDAPVYRFIPGITTSEGLFMCILRKTSSDCVSGKLNTSSLHVIYDGMPKPTKKGKDVIPDHAEALQITLSENQYPRVELSLEQALQYLRREAMVLPESAPRGYIIVTYKHHPLGFVKNIGNRANNLYPQEWKIRKL